MNVTLSFISDYFHTSPGYHVRPQIHSHHEIVLYGEGCHGKTTIDGKECEFKAHDIVVNRSGTEHSEIHFGYGVIRYVAFDYESFSLENGIYHMPFDAMPIFDSILRETINQTFGYEDIISYKLRELIIYIKRTSIASSNNAKTLIFIKNYIYENYGQNINMHDLASLSGYSDSHFRYLFANDFGCSPREYLIEKRCQKAIELLKYTDMSCVDIANQCGFYDSSQFTKMLKRKNSSTPATIRNQHSS